MSTELNLRFPDDNHVIVRLGTDDDGSGQLAFTNPITDKDLRDIQWYVETYGAHSLGDPDDQEAARIAGKLPVWGKALFDAVFTEREAQRRFNDFQDAEDDTRLLTISAEHPAILALPWELLHDPASGGGFLFMETPRISIRRRVAGATGGRGPFQPAAKDTLHLLFVVSRPDGRRLPRSARRLAARARCHRRARPRPRHLRIPPPAHPRRLDRAPRRQDTSRRWTSSTSTATVSSTATAGCPNARKKRERTRIRHLEEILRDKKADGPDDPDCPPNTGYLLFEKPDGQSDFVSAEKLGANLHRHKVALVILSACQSAAVARRGARKTAGPNARWAAWPRA